MSNILETLRGTDLRSIGRANEIVHDIQKNPTLFKSVFKGLTHNDAVIKMRSADIVEKVTRDKSSTTVWLYATNNININQRKTARSLLAYAQIAPRLKYNQSEENKLIRLLKNCLLHNSKIVQVSAMDSLVQLAEKNAALKNDIADVINKQMENGSPAVKARGRKLMHRIAKITNNQA